MNTNFKIKLLQNLSTRKANQGFTLIELLVVVIIIGVLAAIALPNLLGQVAKGRQAEAKNNLGAINRGQQAYFSEKGVFAQITPTSSAVGVKVSWQYYGFTEATGGTQNYTSTAGAVSTYQNDIKNYLSSVAVDNTGNFASIICESVGTAANAGTIGAVTTWAAGTNFSCTTGNQVN